MLIDIFSVGEKMSNGNVVNTTIQDLYEIAETYNNSKQEAPLVIGHVNETTAPALGWAKSLKVKGNTLLADVETNDLFDKKVLKEKQYKNISIRLSKDKRLKHIALLGASIPADSNISSIDFSDNDNENDIIYDFAAPTIIDIKGIIGYDVTADDIQKQIKNKDNILIRLNSPGGYLADGIAIYNMLLSKEPKIMIYGNTSSAATVISQAAGTGKLGIANNVNFLIHQPRVGLMGYYLNNELNDMTHNLDIDRKNILSVYKNRIKDDGKFEVIEKEIDNEKVFSAEQAKKIGLVDFIFDPAKEDLDFSLSGINDIMFNFTHRVEKKENDNLETKEIEMTEPNVIDYDSKINELQSKYENLIKAVDAKDAQIIALQTQTKLLKEKELKTTVKNDLQKIANLVHIDSDNATILNETLNTLIDKDIEIYNSVINVISNIKPKAPQGEFVPENIEALKAERNVNNEVELIEAYAEKNNKTFVEVVDMIADGRITIETLKGVK